jgi:hypothetical protein
MASGVLAGGKVTALGRKGTLPFSWGNRSEFPPLFKIVVNQYVGLVPLNQFSYSPSHLEVTTNLLDDLNFATTCWVVFVGFLRFGEFTYEIGDLTIRPIFLATKLTRSDVRFSSSLDYV